jgi:hypothetical protein
MLRTLLQETGVSLDNVSGHSCLITAIFPINNKIYSYYYHLKNGIHIQWILPTLKYCFSVSSLHCNYAFLECADMHFILSEAHGNDAAAERL